MTYENILYEKQGKIARIILNRPEKLNALSRDLLADVDAALKEAAGDDEVRVVILKAAGRCFSSKLPRFASIP